MKISNLFEDAFQFSLSSKKKFLGLSGIFMAYIAIIFISTYLFTINQNFLILSVGGILAIVLSILADGYGLKTIKESIEGKTEPPELNNWAGMFIGGFKISVVGLIYMIIPGLFILASMIPVFNSLINHNVPDFGIGSLILLLVGMILFVIYVFISPLIQSNLAYKGFKSAFNIKDILGHLAAYGKVNYFIFVIVLGLILMCLVFIAVLIRLAFEIFVPFLGQIITALILYPFILLFRSRAIALVYRETLELETPEVE